MGSELVIRRWCDQCEARGDDVEEIRIAIGGHLDRTVDLCPACFSSFLDPVVTMFADLGTSTGSVVQQPTGKRQSPGAALNIDLRCKLCLKVSATPGGLWQHAKNIHEMTRAQYRAAATRPESALGQKVLV